jgi:hypothetical protein
VRGARKRRLDVLAVPWDAKGAALIYYTVRPGAPLRRAARG